MRIPGLEYRKAETLEKAMAFYRGYEGNALFLAGGNDMIPILRLGFKTPTALIDRKGLRSL